MAVTLPSVYQDGTATIAASGTVVTGQSTLWTKAILPGDFFGVHKGYAVRILSVDTDTQLTLANAWPGAAQTTAHYEIMLQSDIARMQETSRQLLQQLGNGNIAAFSGLVGAADTLGYFTGSGVMALTGLTAVGRDIIDSPDVATARATLKAARTDGTNTFSAAQTFGDGSDNSSLLMNAAVASANIIRGSKASSLRWQLSLGNNTAESGSNAGSDFVASRYSDAGAFIDNPVTISRATGIMSVLGLSLFSGGNIAMGTNGAISFSGTGAATTRTNLGAVAKAGDTGVGSLAHTAGTTVTIPTGGAAGSVSVNLDGIGAPWVIAASALISPAPATFSGLIIANSLNDGSTAVFLCGGNNIVMVSQSIATGIFSGTAGTASKICGEVDTANGRYYLINRFGSSVSVNVFLIRLRAGA